MCSLLFLSLKITEIEHCEKSQVISEHLRTSLGETLKASVAAEVEFPQTSGSGSLLNF